MNDQRIYELIAATPLIRTVQLADKLGVDIEVIDKAMPALIDCGEVVAQDVLAPNSRKATGFDFSDEFKRTQAYRSLMADLKKPKEIAHSVSKVQRAVDFITERGTATSAELHQLLGLKPEENASSYLASALKSGRLVKEGKTWALGTNKAALYPADAVTRQAAIVAAVFPTVPKVEIPKFVQAPRQIVAAASKVEKETSTVKPAAPPQVEESAQQPTLTSTPSFRIGTWSDGTIELQRDGRSLATLTIAESDVFFNFLSSMPLRREVANG